jgi:hypothetical protein
MSFSNATETALLELLFKNTAFALIGDASGLQPSATAGSFYVRLHTADPGEAGTGSTSEATYTGYAPVAVARSGAGWTVSGANVSNTATVQFGECTAGSDTIQYASICLGSGAGAQILVRAALAASRAVSAGITPLFNPGEISGTLD